MVRELVPHPDSQHGPVRGLNADAVRAGDLLSLRYRLTGVLHHIAIPRQAAPARTDELWKHTCFEAFIRADGESGYCEINVSPSTQWAAYSFSGYREGMAALDIPPPQILADHEADALDLSVMIDLSETQTARKPWRLAVSAVIENDAGQRTYWALTHATGKPDFHHPDGFILNLAP